MPRNVLVIQHERHEGMGRIEPVLRERGMTPTVIRGDLSEPLPDTSDLESLTALVVLGGSMGVGDLAAQPELRSEYAFVKQALAINLPTLGICLGSQLMAKALGSRSWTGEWELGWHPVDRSAALSRSIEMPERFPAFHWHRDRFSTPPGATKLAQTASTPCQAFSKGPHLGLLFHLEADVDRITAMAEHLSSDLSESHMTLDQLQQDAIDSAMATSNLAESFFGQWADKIPAKGSPK